MFLFTCGYIGIRKGKGSDIVRKTNVSEVELVCYGNFGPPKILVLGTKFSRKICPGGPILPEKFDPCPNILVLPYACACAFSYTC